MLGQAVKRFAAGPKCAIPWLMTSFTFVHVADLHLDAPFRGVSSLLESGRDVPPGTAASMPSSFSAGSHGGRLASFLQNATFTALERLTRLCIDARADFLLLAGDIYNSSDSSLRARLALRESFLQLEKAGITVFMAHGNHDPYGGEQSAVPWPANVHVFGETPGAYPAMRGDAFLALVQGISHSRPGEDRNLARMFQRNIEPQWERAFQIGLLHCAVTGRSGAHAAYAPCSVDDLDASGLDYWALGHVHGPQLFRRPGALAGDSPLAAYSGSSQGLHVNESGPHGCLLVRVDESRQAVAEFVPLAPVRWETAHLRLDGEREDIENLTALMELAREEMDALAASIEKRDSGAHETPGRGTDNGRDPGLHERQGLEVREKWSRGTHAGWRPELLIVRLHLDGRTALNAELRKGGALEDMREHMNRELAGSGMLLRDIVLETRPPVDEAALLLRDDLAGETQRIAQGLLQEPERLKDMAEQALKPLFNRSGVRQNVSFPGEAELAVLAEEARLLCQNLLEGE